MIPWLYYSKNKLLKAEAEEVYSGSLQQTTATTSAD